MGRKFAHPSRYAEDGGARIKRNESLLLSLYFSLRFHLFILCASKFGVLRVSRHLGFLSLYFSLTFHLFILCASEFGVLRVSRYLGLLSLYFSLRFHLFILRAPKFGVLRVSRQLGIFSPHQSRYDASISEAPRLVAISNYIASVIDVLSADFGLLSPLWLNHRQKVLLILT